MCPDTLLSSTPAQLAELFGAVSGELNAPSMGLVLQALQRSNLSMPRLVALFYLRRRGAATISELSEHLNLTLGSTSQAIDQLVQAGLVERREDAHDRRHKLVTLTPAGAAVVAEVRQIRIDEAARRLADLPPELLTTLAATLAAALATLRQEQPVGEA